MTGVVGRNTNLKAMLDYSKPDTARMAGLRPTGEKKWVLLPNGGPEWSSCKYSAPTSTYSDKCRRQCERKENLKCVLFFITCHRVVSVNPSKK
jgi:hypothetical protein